VHYGLGGHFAKVVACLYEDCVADIYINDEVSGQFPVARGVCQGDTLSPLLFILTLNPLLEWLQEGQPGYTFGKGLCVPIIAYCDDLALLSDSAVGMRAAFAKLLQFCRWAGLEVNPAKSVYSCTRGALAALAVPDYNTLGAVCHPITVLSRSKSYKYMGVWINLDGSWEHQKKWVKE
jgi:hypothetical protein